MVTTNKSTITETLLQIDLASPRKQVSANLYGMNSPLFSDDPLFPDKATWLKAWDAGVRIVRLNGGNNATKYNWKKKLSSHPDWYNNVYPNNWDQAAVLLEKNLPGTSGMWAFQLLGKVAATAEFNFNGNDFNGSRWWEGVCQNLAGNGIPNLAGGSKASREGDPNLYLTNWTAADTVGILDHWFGKEGLGLNNQLHQYWNMDNEPDIWNLKHNDVITGELAAEEFLQNYFEVAKKARARFPAIKLCGPAAANEWQWYTWNDKPVVYEGQSYAWLEYFIKRIAEEQKACNVRLLDLLDLHFYPNTTRIEEIVQLHRVFFDQTFTYPEASGIKILPGQSNGTENKEFIFERCRQWLEKYLGPHHGVGLGLSETEIKVYKPDVVAVWYASMLGEFMKQGVELFTPWSWQPGMWETLHLFSRFSQKNFVPCHSSDDILVSGYPTTDDEGVNLTIILVNRSLHSLKNVTIAFNAFDLYGKQARLLTLPPLPEKETFMSHTSNALVSTPVQLSGDGVTLQLAPMSISALLIST